MFEIDEGDATKVKAINFIGNRAFSDSQLRDIISTTQSSLFDFLKGTNIYDPDRLTLDRELLRQYYLKNGYADARVVSAGAELDRDGSGFFITFVVDEGELFKFGVDRLESALPTVNTASAAQRGADRERHDLRPVQAGQDGRAADAGRLRAGLCLRPRAPARRPRARRAASSTSPT